MAKGGQTAKAGTGEQMKAAWKLFDAGDKRAARDEAARVLAEPPNVADAEEARELLSRLAPPPIFRTLAILAACLIAALIVLAVFRG